MANHSKNEVRLTRSAQRDVVEITEWTIREFGPGAVVRYRALIAQALDDIGADPERMGSKARPEIKLEAMRTYHISLSRTRVRGVRVKNARHFLLYRRRPNHAVEVVRILHDSRELARHLRDVYWSADEE